MTTVSGPRGLSELAPEELGKQVLNAWDGFLDVADASDLALPSRLPRWTGLDTCVHLGAWEDHAPLEAIVASARAGAGGEPPRPDDSNARLLAAHRDASREQVLAGLVRARDAMEAFFDSARARELGRVPARSSLGPLPVLTLVHASCYELAVHALDLAPCGAPPPPPQLLDRGLAALLDVTGALACRAGTHVDVTAQAPTGGWAFRSDPQGWTTRSTAAGRFDGTGVRGAAADLLDASAGRAALPQLLLTRRLVVQDLPSFLRLAPLVHELPGLPGGAALRSGVVGLSAVTGGVNRVLGRLGRR